MDPESRLMIAAFVMRKDADSDAARTHNAREALKAADALLELHDADSDQLKRTIQANRKLVDQLHDAHAEIVQLRERLAALEPAPVEPAAPPVTEA